MTIKTRKPTGKAPWPMLLIAGVEKSGKSYSCAQFSASDMVGRTFYIEVGEGSADQYGALTGARYEIVEHDGSWQGILDACKAAVVEPSEVGKPNCIVLDSASELWALLCDEQQSVASGRGKSIITMDQWNAAKRRWRQVIDALRSSKGPVLITARYEQVTVMKDGKPTTDKEWKVRAEKDLAFEVDGIIAMKEPRKPVVAGIRTVAFEVPAGGIVPRDQSAFEIEGFLRSLNIDGGERVYIPRKEDPDAYNPAPDAVTPESDPEVVEAEVVEDDPVDTPDAPAKATTAQVAQIKRGVTANDIGNEAAKAMVQRVTGRADATTANLTGDEATAILAELAAFEGPAAASADTARAAIGATS
jgi:hypothetical protein